MSMKEYEVPPEWAFEKKDNKYLSINKKSLFKDSKKIKKKFYDSASFVIYTKKQLLNSNKYFNFYGHIMEKDRAIDIDTESDWQHALKLYKLKN